MNGASDRSWVRTEAHSPRCGLVGRKGRKSGVFPDSGSSSLLGRGEYFIKYVRCYIFGGYLKCIIHVHVFVCCVYECGLMK